MRAKFMWLYLACGPLQKREVLPRNNAIGLMCNWRPYRRRNPSCPAMRFSIRGNISVSSIRRGADGRGWTVWVEKSWCPAPTKRVSPDVCGASLFGRRGPSLKLQVIIMRQSLENASVKSQCAIRKAAGGAVLRETAKAIYPTHGASSARRRKS